MLGASGFIGRHLVTAMANAGMDAIAITRRPAAGLAVENRVVTDFRDSKNLASAIGEATRIVHLADEAGRFAAADDREPIAASLAKALDSREVRLVFASSIYARLHEESQPNSYGKRKLEQERLLLPVTRTIGLRLPPVYGPGCGGSFAMLERAVSRGLPLPLGRAVMKRSYLSVDNLSSLIIALLDASQEAWEAGAPRLYEPEDKLRISTHDLAIALARRHHRHPRLLPVPQGLLRIAGRMSGKQALVSGAFDELAARDNGTLDRLFGWQPRDGLPDSIAQSDD